MAATAQNVPRSDGPAVGYRRHRPEQTLLYQIVAQHYPRFAALMNGQGRPLPAFVRREFAAYLRCGRLEHGFMRVRCTQCRAENLVAFSCKGRGLCPSCGARRMVDTAALLVDDVLPHQPVRQWVLSVPFELRFVFARYPAVMSAVLGIVIRAIETHLIGSAGYTRGCAHTGAVTLIQRFGGALNLNIHFHMLFLDGVYVAGRRVRLRFVQVPPPTPEQLTRLVNQISQRVGRHLERRGLIERDVEHAHLALEPGQASALDPVLGASITYRIAVGPHRGHKAFTLQTLAAVSEDEANETGQLACAGGFSLHAGISAAAHQRERLERLCRYIARPAVATQRVALTRQGLVRYTLKSPWRDGTTHVIFEPLDFIARLAALIPRPRVNLTRFHGVFAPNSRWRADITPAGRGRRTDAANRPPHRPRNTMNWAARLKRVFRLDMRTCEHCGGMVKILASISDPQVIERILKHLARRHTTPTEPHRPRAPPLNVPGSTA